MYQVYCLVDVRDNSVFYIGAGTHKRGHEHMRDYLAGKRTNICKDMILGELARAGLQPKVVSLYWFATMDEAYERERETIAAMRGAGYALTNVHDGGRWVEPPTCRQTLNSVKKRTKR